jgi:hypothetical protein
VTHADGERWLLDAAPGAWITVSDSGRGAPLRVCDLVPAGYAAYARILHPVEHPDAGELRWAELARRTGLAAGPDVSVIDVLDVAQRQVSAGRIRTTSFLTKAEWRTVGAILERRTDSRRFYVGVWEGRGTPEAARDAALLELPDRRYFLASLPFTSWPSSSVIGDLVLPNLVWPEDRAWFLNSDVDSVATIVGGSAAAIDELVSAPNLEASAVRFDADPWRGL